MKPITGAIGVTLIQVAVGVLIYGGTYAPLLLLAAVALIWYGLRDIPNPPPSH